MKRIAILAILAVNTWTDIRKKQINVPAVIFLAVTGMVSVFVQENGKGHMSVMVFLPGILVLFISVVTKGAVGMGDAFLLLALGTVLSPEELMEMVCIAMLLCSLAALALMVIFRKKRNMAIPFIPFLLAGYIGGLIL